MDNGLVVVEDTPRHAELLTEAAQHARGKEDAELVVLAFATEEEISPGVQKIESIGELEGVSYDHGEESIIEAAEEELASFVEETLGEVPEEFTITVEVLGEGYGMGTLNAAEDYGCDHIFIAGRRRSPTGKAIFGDWIQRVLLNFDDPVTVSLNEEE